MKSEKRSVTGVLLLDKPLGISSNAALTRVKIAYNASKAGHTGTLDPLASGLLPICLGEATKFAGFMLDADKTYEAVVRLGRTTTTGDREGDVLTESPVEVTEAQLTEALQRFTGPISQKPPMYSALKVQGQPLYRLARQGVTIEREARDIVIRQLDLLAFESPLLKIRVACSKGAYIRVLAEDIGRELGCGGTLEDLRRTRTGDFALEDALTLEVLAALPLEGRDARLAAPDRLVSRLPRIELDDRAGQALQEGRIVSVPHGQGAGIYRAYGEAGAFFGLVDVASGVIKARRMMSTPILPRSL